MYDDYALQRLQLLLRTRYSLRRLMCIQKIRRKLKSHGIASI